MATKNFNILLADDESEIAMLVSSVLRKSGHSVDVARDGEVAFSRIKENISHYDLLITDSNMPLMSGVELIQQIRQLDFPGRIILLSGYVVQEMQETYDGLRIDRIIQKPFVFSELRVAVDEVGAMVERHSHG